jgi:hypothetical protein
MLIPQPQINDAPIKTEEIAATEFNDDITMSNVTLGRNGNDISRAHATMSSGEFARLPPSCKTGGLRHKHDPPTLRPICRYITELYLALFNLAGAAEQRERNSFMRRELPDLGCLSRQPGFRRHG